MAVFVTVGTTAFDELIDRTNDVGFREAIVNLGYSRLIIQYGCGSIIPVTEVSHVTNKSNKISLNTLDIVSFRYENDLKPRFSEAALVISHGGAGTCLQALTPPGSRKLLIVINESLMGNHQHELASTLLLGGHALMTSTGDLIRFLSTGIKGLSTKYDFNIYERFSTEVTSLLGLSTTPEEAGFVPFFRGSPSKLKCFLDTCFGFTTT